MEILVIVLVVVIIGMGWVIHRILTAPDNHGGPPDDWPMNGG